MADQLRSRNPERPRLRRAGVTALALSCVTALAGCACTPAGPAEPVRTVVPASLTAGCHYDPPLENVGDLYEAVAEARVVIAECDYRLGELRRLTEPKTTKPAN
jgi:hypothetical protein